MGRSRSTWRGWSPRTQRWARPWKARPRYLRAEVAYAVTDEGALHLDDVMLRRTRIAMEYPDHGEASATEVAGIMAPLLGWNAEDLQAELGRYRHAVGVPSAGADNSSPG